MDYVIRPATYKELEILIGWAAKEGWNPGLYDAEAFYNTDPQGFFLGFLNDEPIASISAVRYDDSFGFLGFYIVKPLFRNQGYGIKIWNEALKHLPTQNIGLDGVVAQQDNYKKSGFKLAYRNIRYEGVGIKEDRHFSDIVHLSEIPLEKLTAYDEQIFSVRRTTFLSYWIKQPQSLPIGMMKNDNLTGYGVIRKSRVGFKVGPLFTDNAEIANQLFQKMRNFAGFGQPIFLDVPEVNKDAVLLAESYKMKPMFETARMYTKEVPNKPINKIFGVTTFELG